MKRQIPRNHGGAVVAIACAGILSCTSSASAQVIGRAATFAIVGEAISANGAVSTVRGNIGSPAGAASIIGFPAPGIIVVPFSNLTNTQPTLDARTDLLALYGSAPMAPLGASDTGLGVPGAGNNLSISGPTSNGLYPPGRYTNVAGGVATIPTSITLTTPGVYVFTLANALTAAGNVILGAGVDPCTVFWRTGAGSQATINGRLVGTVVSDGIIALGVGATVGRALTTATGSVTLAGANTVGGCSGVFGGPPVAPSMTKTFNPAVTVPGGRSTLTITFANPNPTGATLLAPLVDQLPAGVVIAAIPSASTTCGGAVVAPAGGSTITLTQGSTIPAGSCFLVVDVTAAALGTYTNTLPINSLVTDSGNNASAASAILTIVAVVPVPTLPEWALIILAVSLGLIGFVGLRRRLSQKRIASA